MSNNYPWFIGAKLKLKGPYADGLLLPDLIKQELENGLVIEIVGTSENDFPRFIHNLGMTAVNNLVWSLIDSEAEHFELVNPRTDNMASPVYVSDLHPKDIALVQAMHIIHRTQQRIFITEEFEHDVVSHKYMTSNFLTRSIDNIKSLQGYGEDLMQDLTINYNLKGVK